MSIFQLCHLYGYIISTRKKKSSNHAHCRVRGDHYHFAYEMSTKNQEISQSVYSSWVKCNDIVLQFI